MHHSRQSRRLDSRCNPLLKNRAMMIRHSFPTWPAWPPYLVTFAAGVCELVVDSVGVGGCGRVMPIRLRATHRGRGRDRDRGRDRGRARGRDRGDLGRESRDRRRGLCSGWASLLLCLCVAVFNCDYHDRLRCARAPRQDRGAAILIAPLQTGARTVGCRDSHRRSRACTNNGRARNGTAMPGTLHPLTTRRPLLTNTRIMGRQARCPGFRPRG
jgi:hypothetical protein